MPENVMDFQANLGFMRAQTTYVERQVNEQKYPEIQYPRLGPVVTEAHPFAKTVTFISTDQVGQADWINGNSMTMPMAEVLRNQYESPIWTAGMGYSYGWEEVGQARMLGINLQTDKAMAARKAAERFIDDLFLFGNTAKGLKGLTNHGAPTAANVTTGTWDAAARTSQEIINDINEVILKVPTGTEYTEMANTVLLPYTKIVTLASRVLPGTTMTVLQFIKTANIYTVTTGQALTIMGVRGLESAGAGTTNRMIAYYNDPMILKMHLPMPHRFLNDYMYQMGLNVCVPGVFRVGGLDIRRPKSVRYGDGI